MDGESTIAAKTGPHKRAAAEVAPAAEMHTAAKIPAAEMPTAMAAEMAATVKMPSATVTTPVATSTVAPAAMTAAATFRSRIAGDR
jgi:hypothetical protein